jgi:multiple sugar transport system substrate-binding protein
VAGDHQPDRLTQMVGERRISRRELLRHAAILGLGSSSLGALLTACGGGEEKPTGKEANTITWSVQSFAHEALQPFLTEFKDKTDITVKLESGPATAQDVMTKLIPAFSSGTTPYDVVDVGDPDGEAFIRGGWLESLDSVLSADFWDDFSPSMKESTATWSQVDGKTYRIYHNWELGYFWNRKDILGGLNLEIPTTWDELVEVGTKAKQREQMFGFADAASKPGLMFVYLAYLTAQAGGNLYEFDEGTRNAFKFAHDLIYEHEIFPKEALTWSYDQLNASYTGDKLLTMREWTFFWDVAAGQKQWYKPEKANVSLPPAGPGGAKTWAGGWGWSVPKFTEKKEAALEFIKFISSKENAPRLAKANSFFATARNSVLQELGNEGILQYMKLYTEKGAVTPRPYTQQSAKAETVVDDVGQGYLTNQMDLDTAMQQGKQRIAALR